MIKQLRRAVVGSGGVGDVDGGGDVAWVEVGVD